MKILIKNLTKAFLLIMVFICVSCEKESPTEIRGIPFQPIYSSYFGLIAWHPDGEWIAVEHVDSVDTNYDGKYDDYCTGTWLVHSETGAMQHLLTRFERPAWRPDGEALAMKRSGNIYTIDVLSLNPARVDTNNLKMLTTSGRNSYPSWSPDGEWIAFESETDTSSRVIWKMKSDGSQKTDISEHGMGEWLMPDWSPDNIYIACSGYAQGFSYREIFIMDTGGQNYTRFTFNNYDDKYPKYSPDGSMIAFISEKNSLWIMKNDGSYAKRIVGSLVHAFDWSPDGTKIVFISFASSRYRQPGNGQLWIINADESGLHQLTYYNEIKIN